ncbi:hypothetical protein DPMN_136388 [Dreissena polymorpha]|uniref:Uncharacterized protein n=1 Tax=Dreissena polymorpha TaxID=45954 RepID=A0A9D4JDQ9_DREPO|nr:hypothetical protein DPMN_136388 [Dreissena polymorpha]
MARTTLNSLFFVCTKQVPLNLFHFLPITGGGVGVGVVWVGRETEIERGDRDERETRERERERERGRERDRGGEKRERLSPILRAVERERIELLDTLFIVR